MRVQQNMPAQQLFHYRVDLGLRATSPLAIVRASRSHHPIHLGLLGQAATMPSHPTYKCAIDRGLLKTFHHSHIAALEQRSCLSVISVAIIFILFTSCEHQKKSNATITLTSTTTSRQLLYLSAAQYSAITKSYPTIY